MYPRIRDLREDADLTQKELAENLVCHKPDIQNMKQAKMIFRQPF